MERNRFLNTTNKISYRRSLRKNQTKAEQILWFHLKNRKLAGSKFRRQHSIGPYIVDFLHTESNTIIELDGDVHFLSDQQMNKDATRQLWLQNKGFSMLRFNNIDVIKNLQNVLDHIYYNITVKSKTIPRPHPNPLLTGEGKTKNHPERVT